jgi:hypothetical protein
VISSLCGVEKKNALLPAVRTSLGRGVPAERTFDSRALLIPERDLAFSYCGEGGKRETPIIGLARVWMRLPRLNKLF